MFILTEVYYMRKESVCQVLWQIRKGKLFDLPFSPYFCLPFHRHISHMPVEAPPVFNGLFLFFEEYGGLFRIGCFEALVSHFVVDVVFKRQRRFFAVYYERVFALFRKVGVVAH